MADPDGFKTAGTKTIKLAPFGAYYAGAAFVLFGGVMLATPLVAFGAVLALSGMMLICTGLIQGSIFRHP